MVENLKKEIGVWSLAANMVNIIIGAGIFVLPALIAEGLGIYALVPYLICGVLMICIVLCLVEVGKKFDRSGGVATYLTAGFGKYIGFLSTVLFWFGTGVIMNAAVANALADLLQINSTYYRILFFLITFGLFAWINILGVKHGSRLVVLLTVLKLLPLLMFIFIGITKIELQNIQAASSFDWSTIGKASLMLFFAFGGGESALSASGEIKDPSHTIPKAIYVGITIVIIVYMLVQIVTYGILGNDILNHKNAPLQAAALVAFGLSGSWIVSMGGISSMLGNLSGSTLAFPRILYAGALQGWFPKFLASIHTKYQSPHWAIVFHCTLAFVFALLGNFKNLAILASGTLLLVYFGIVLMVFKERLSKLNFNTSIIKNINALIVPILASCGILYLLANLSKHEMLGFITAAIAVSVWYFVKNNYFVKTNS